MTRVDGERFVNLTGVAPVVGKGKVKFVSLTPKQIDHFHDRLRNGTSRDLVVYMALLNVVRVLHEQEFQFTPKWRDWLGFDNHVIRRALQRLSKGGLIEVEFQRGKSPRVVVIDKG